MEEIKCIIVDDEPLAVELLADYVQRSGFLKLVNSFCNPLDALPFIRQNDVDIIFLDVQMQELNGLQFIKLLNGKTKVILITAYPDYAIQGYEMNVVDYLLKPVLFERFLQAAQKAIPLKVSSIFSKENFEESPNAEGIIFVRSDYKIIKIWLNDILFIEGRKEYIAIHTPREIILSLQNMKKTMEILPADKFLRVHRSYIIAIHKIDSIERNRILIGNALIPIGETYRPAFFGRLAEKNLL